MISTPSGSDSRGVRHSGMAAVRMKPEGSGPSALERLKRAVFRSALYLASDASRHSILRSSSPYSNGCESLGVSCPGIEQVERPITMRGTSLSRSEIGSFSASLACHTTTLGRGDSLRCKCDWRTRFTTCPRGSKTARRTSAVSDNPSTTRILGELLTAMPAFPVWPSWFRRRRALRSFATHRVRQKGAGP